MSTAHKYIKKDSVQSYFLSRNQYSIHPFQFGAPATIECTDEEPKNVITTEDLNEEGIVLLNKVLNMVKNEEYKDVINDSYLVRSTSGYWEVDDASPYFGTPHPNLHAGENIKKVLNMWNNVNVTGVGSKGHMETSACIFVNEGTREKDGWCYTRSGSLYKLVK